MTVISNETGIFSYYFMRLWVLPKSIFSWLSLTGKGWAPPHCLGGGRNPGPPLSLHWHLRGDILFIILIAHYKASILGKGGSSSSLRGLLWPHSGVALLSLGNGESPDSPVGILWHHSRGVLGHLTVGKSRLPTWAWLAWVEVGPPFLCVWYLAGAQLLLFKCLRTC